MFLLVGPTQDSCKLAQGRPISVGLSPITQGPPTSRPNNGSRVQWPARFGPSLAKQRNSPRDMPTCCKFSFSTVPSPDHAKQLRTPYTSNHLNQSFRAYCPAPPAYPFSLLFIHLPVHQLATPAAAATLHARRHVLSQLLKTGLKKSLVPSLLRACQPHDLQPNPTSPHASNPRPPAMHGLSSLSLCKDRLQLP